jgi:hypothetical protein
VALEIFGLGSQHDDYVGLAGATPQLYSVAPYRFDYRIVDEYFIFCRFDFFPPINQLVSFVFKSFFFATYSRKM